MSPSATTNSRTDRLSFENNISHRLPPETFGNKTVIYFMALHLDGISESTCLQIEAIDEVI